MKKKYTVDNLDCANCAAKMEDAINKLDGVEKASLSFITGKLKIEFSDDSKIDAILNEIDSIIKRIEPDALLVK